MNDEFINAVSRAKDVVRKMSKDGELSAMELMTTGIILTEIYVRMMVKNGKTDEWARNNIYWTREFIEDILNKFEI